MRTLGGARRERNPEATRARILAAAEADFSRKGYDGTRLRDVALTARVHHTLVHHYFADKEGLFRAVVERAFGSLSSQAFAVLDREAAAREFLDAAVSMLVGFYAENPRLVQILHLASLDEGSPAFAICEEIAMSTVMPMMDATTDRVEEAQRRGEIRDDVPARRLVAIAMGAAGHVFHEEAFFRNYLGEDVRSRRSLAEHRRAAAMLIADALLVAPAGVGVVRKPRAGRG